MSEMDRNNGGFAPFQSELEGGQEPLGQVDKAKEIVEAARERMAEAMKERKMHETLREKAFEAFLQEENHAESKAIDELTSYTYGQKKPAGGLRQREDINGKRKDSGRADNG